MNTPQKGSSRYIVFREGKVWYAAALDLNIVEASDDPRNALVGMMDAIQGYVEAVRKIRGGRVNHLLNQKADPEYEKLWTALHGRKNVKSPYQIHSYGVTSA